MTSFIYVYINKDIHIYNNLRLTAMLAIIAHIHILYIYIYKKSCTCIKTGPFTVGRLAFACEAIGTSFICLKDVERRCERLRDSWCFA